MRRAELITAGILGAFSIYLMWKSAELPIGWIKDYGPGGGVFPFYLSLGMLVCTVIIFIQGVLRTSSVAMSEAPFLNEKSKRLLLVVGGALTVMIALIHVVGVYFSVPLFVIFYMRYLGGHRWGLTLLLAMLIPVGTFLFFEKLLLILLPKGLTDEWFYIFF